jgi:uncharacterized protein (DUF305 family)
VGSSETRGSGRGGGILSGVRSTIGDLPPTGKLVVGIVAALIVGLLGFTIGVSVGRPNHPGDGSPEVGFARDMSVHHAQAVEMGMIAFQKASSPGIRSMAGDIANTQQAQIGIMKQWLQEWGVPVNTTARPMSWLPDGESMLQGNLMPGMATREEIAELQAATGEQVDILFLQYMIRHHLGGIHMVDGVLDLNPTAEVRELAQGMKNAQQREIDAMKTMLTSLGASPLTD